MATITLPSTPRPREATIQLERPDDEVVTMRSGTAQILLGRLERWRLTLAFPPIPSAEPGNLLGADAGWEQSSTSFHEYYPDAAPKPLAELGVSVDEAVAWGGEARTDGAGHAASFKIAFFDSLGGIISQFWTAGTTSTTWARATASTTVPSGATSLSVRGTTDIGGRSWWRRAFLVRSLCAPILYQDPQGNLRGWQAALLPLAQLDNDFLYPPPDYAGPSTGYAGPPPLVAGANQTGSTLVCDGVTPSTPILRAGDWLEVGGELKLVTADAVSDATGVVTFAIRPALRASPTDNASAAITEPKGRWRLTQPVAGINTDVLRNAELQIEAVEAL